MPPPNIAHGSFHPFEVFKISWWMRHYGACTPKRHVGLCNNVWFDRLNLGKLTKKDRKGCTLKTVVKYVSKSGRPSYKGTSALKSTQFLARILGLYLYLSMQGLYEKQNWILGWTPYYPLFEVLLAIKKTSFKLWLQLAGVHRCCPPSWSPCCVILNCATDIPPKQNKGSFFENMSSSFFFKALRAWYGEASP